MANKIIMYRRIILLIGAFILCLAGNAQTMKEVVLSMPDSIMPLLSKDNKADFIDFLASKMRAKVKNAFNEYSYMDTLTTDYASIRLTPVSSVSLKLLPLTDSTKVICMVHTYKSDASDSKISFYDTKWHALKTEDFVTVPSGRDFVNNVTDVDSLQLIQGKLDLSMVVAHLSPANMDLKFSFDDAYLSWEDKALVKKRIRQAIVKKWENGRFVSK